MSGREAHAPVPPWVPAPGPVPDPRELRRGELARSGSEENVERALAWMSAHPGWEIDPCVPPWFRLLDPAGVQQAAGEDLGVLMDGLERADLRVETEREQLALLRSEFRRWSIVVCDGWEATRHGINRVTAAEAWLLGYRLREKERKGRAA